MSHVPFALIIALVIGSPMAFSGREPPPRLFGEILIAEQIRICAWNINQMGNSRDQVSGYPITSRYGTILGPGLTTVIRSEYSREERNRWRRD